MRNKSRSNNRSRFMRRVGLFGASVLLLASSTVEAQSDGGRSGLSADDVRQMAEELRQNRDDIHALRQEVKDLRAMNGDEWLTERRAEEIRSVVEDVLLDADTRSSLLQGGTTAGWDDGFFLSSADGNFLFEIDYLAQFRHVENRQDVTADTWRGGFEITRSELTMRGHIYNRDLTYLVRADVTRNEAGLVNGLWFLKDAWVRYNLHPDWSLRFGQFKVPFSREELVAPEYQLAVERTLINETTNLGRTQGIELMWARDHWRVMGVVGDGATDNLGGFGLIEPGGAPINSAALIFDTEWSMAGRAELKLAGTWDQFKDFTSPRGDPFGLLLGVGGLWERGEHGVRAGINQQETWWGVTADVSAEFGGANLFAAGTYEYVSGNDLGNTNRPNPEFEMFGFVLQGGWYVTDNVEVFTRYEWGQPITNILQLKRQRRNRRIFEKITFDSLNVLTLGANWYLHGHDSKLTFDFGYAFTEINAPFDSDLAGYRQDPDDSTGQFVIRTQYQLRF